MNVSPVRGLQEGRGAFCLGVFDARGKELPVSRQAIAKHLEVLAQVGLVEGQRHGREVVHHPVGARLSELGRDLQRIGEVWEHRLAGIKRIAEES